MTSHRINWRKPLAGALMLAALLAAAGCDPVSLTMLGVGSAHVAEALQYRRGLQPDEAH